MWTGIWPPETPARKSWLQIGELWLYTSSSSMDRNLVANQSGSQPPQSLNPEPSAPSLLSSLGKVRQDERALLGRQLVLFLSGLLQQLLPHHGEDGAQQGPAEDLRGLVAGQAVAELGHVAVAQPPEAEGGQSG